MLVNDNFQRQLWCQFHGYPIVSSPGPRGEGVVHFGRVFDEGEVSRNVKMVPLYTSSQVYYELLPGDALLG